MRNIRNIFGFSLIELLVAMAIGSVVIGGAFAMHSGSRKAQKINEMQMDMSADARFAIELISYDLRHAGSWGGTNSGGLINCRSDDTKCFQSSAGETLAGAVIGDCASSGNVWTYNLIQPVFATDGTAGNPYLSTCIPGTESYETGTDIIEMRYADPSVPGVLLNNQAYIRSNALSGKLFVGSPQPLIGNESGVVQNHEFHAYAYYISDHTDAAGDGIPSLRRVALVNGPSLQNQKLLSGVVDMQVQFGIDVDGVADSNGEYHIERYVNPNAIAATDWGNVYSAKIWLVMQSDKKMDGIDTTKTFEIAGAAPKTYGGMGDYRYFMVSSVVNMRNNKRIQ